MLTGDRVWEQPWPEADPALLAADTFELVVQVNGKLRDRIEAPADASREEQEALARQSERVVAQLNGGQVVKTDRRPGQARQLRRALTPTRRSLRARGPCAVHRRGRTGAGDRTRARPMPRTVGRGLAGAGRSSSAAGSAA